jgi:CMP/dCMP kinase
MRKHLAISGELGTGKSTLAVRIGEQLGLEVFATGEFQRRIASSMGLSTLELNEAAMRRADIDKVVDGEAIKLALLADAPMVFDSRMAWHTVPNCFRVRLVADPRVSTARAFGRKLATENYSSIEEAERHLLKRYALERARFSGTYSVDITRLRNFDLVLDTSDLTPEEAANIVVERWRSEKSGLSIGLSPSRVVPLLGYPNGEELRLNSATGTPVGYCRPYFFAFDGEALIRLVESGSTSLVFTSNLLLEQDEVGPEEITACQTLDRYSQDRVRDLVASGFILNSYYGYRNWVI